MITGSPHDKLVVVESYDAWEFTNEVNGAINQNPSLDISTTYVDAHYYKAILVQKKEGD